ncbi:DUF925-domain-containing protein [Penicillium cosmopolitanum]|uniref:DUF925-domain-containing protein n=1 Tax=Penicillium cosmopolitanum TaxID=1131564 RepID=A0A9W9W867_9EURO|nr:DUF925-domain-containing protein [Penicillium cosmopolitanum]KAJ5408123.1 DUF925-domain-containing protein [Penicillium cosmopolitanum]
MAFNNTSFQIPTTSSRQPAQLPINEQLDLFREALGRNRTLAEILRRASAIDLPEWYLASGCLFQTVWNVVTGQDPEAGIADYDLVYFDSSDVSWEAEDTVIQNGHKIFADLPAPVQIRNQARVHLWYKEKLGIVCPQHNSVEAAIATFPTTTACLGVRLLPNGEWRIYAPHGFSDLFNLVVRPNPLLTPRHVYETKAERWQRQWPRLTVFPWPQESSKDSGIKTVLSLTSHVPELDHAKGERGLKSVERDS